MNEEIKKINKRLDIVEGILVIVILVSVFAVGVTVGAVGFW